MYFQYHKKRLRLKPVIPILEIKKHAFVTTILAINGSGMRKAYGHAWAKAVLVFTQVALR